MFGQWTPSKRLRHVPGVFRGRADLLSDPSQDPDAGVAAAESEVVAFVDDAVADRNWLAVMAAPYADPHVLGVGGQIIPVWQTGRPKWFAPEFDWPVGCSYRGMPPGRAQVPSFSGAIMSLRRRLPVDSGHSVSADPALSGDAAHHCVSLVPPRTAQTGSIAVKQVASQRTSCLTNL